MRAGSPRRCVFISGRGSNLAAVLEVPGSEIRLVVTSDAKATGVSKALRSGIPVFVIPRNSSDGLDWSAVDEALCKRSIDAIFLLGFMRIVPASFVDKWSGKILNLHPSLLPKYPGLKSIERAMLADDDIGTCIHKVVAEVDAGSIVHSRKSIDAGHGARVSPMLVHIDEQRIVKEVVETWRR